MPDEALHALQVIGNYTRLCAYFLVDNWNGAAMVLFDLLLLLLLYGLWRSNGRLWVVARRQFELMSEQVRLARDEFHSTHRPKVVLRHAVAPLPLNNDEGAGIIVYATISNIGSTAANVVESNIYVELLTADDRVTLTDPAIRNDLLNGPIAPGESREFAFSPVDQYWDSKARHVYMPTGLGLFLAGHLVYTDESPRPVRRHTLFRRRYSPRDQRFHRVHKDETEHEYAD